MSDNESCGHRVLRCDECGERLAVRERPLLWDRSRAAAAVGISPRTLEEIDARGDGPVRVRIGGAWRYDPDDIRVWIRSCRVEPHPGRETTEAAAMRAWAQAQGYPVGDRGPIPAEAAAAWRRQSPDEREEPGGGGLRGLQREG